MIFGRDHVSCDDFGDCHDEIGVVGVDFIGSRLIYDFYLQGERCFWEPPTKTVTPDHQSHRRWSQEKFKVSKWWFCIAYVVPDDATADILLAI
jgi:hypothetical protein